MVLNYLNILSILNFLNGHNFEIIPFLFYFLAFLYTSVDNLLTCYIFLLLYTSAFL